MVVEADQERLWFATEVFKLFEKAFTQLKLYPHDHKYCVDAVANFAKRLRSYTNMHDVLRLTVHQDTLTVGDHVVYQAPSRTESVAFRLYVDGLRTLTIEKGVTTEEASRLAHVFYNAVVDPLVDATNLLWEGDFRHVDYQAINQLQDAWEQPDFLSSDSLRLLRDMNRNVDEIVDEITAGVEDRDTYSFEMTDGAAETDDLDDVAEQVDEAERAEDEDIFEIPPEALQAFVKEAASWRPDRLLQAVVEASLDGLALEPDMVGRDNVAWLLKEAVEMALRTEDMELLGTLLNRYEGELALAEEDEHEAVLRDVFAWMGQEENVARLVGLAKGSAVGGPSAFCRILGLIGPSGLKAGVETYLDSDSKELKDALLKFIAENLARDPRQLLPLVDPERPADVVRSGLFLLSKQRDLDTQSLEELLNAGREHADPKVQEYATHLWRTMTVEGRVVTSIDALGSENPRDRARALRTIVEGRHTEAIPRLKEVIASGPFVSWETKERHAYLSALRELGGKTSVAFLQQQASRSTGLFNRKKAKEIREMAQVELNKLKHGG